MCTKHIAIESAIVMNKFLFGKKKYLHKNTRIAICCKINQLRIVN